MSVSPGIGGDEMVLRLEEVTAGYEDIDVLKNVTIDVQRSMVVAILGPNGSGKTTLLRYASGLIGGRSGTLRLNGADVTGEASYALARRGICHIPEGRAIFPSLTVRENIALMSPSVPLKDGLESTLAAFPALGSRLNQVAGTLSGGEQQMLALSRAYIGDPAVVLLDEVSMGLAPKVIDEIFASIDGLLERRISLVLVEQYVDRALEIADYVYVLSRGSICSQGISSSFSRDSIMTSYLN
jgi:branched-chain amino acid transport system ATP-binding protein